MSPTSLTDDTWESQRILMTGYNDKKKLESMLNKSDIVEVRGRNHWSRCDKG